MNTRRICLQTVTAVALTLSAFSAPAAIPPWEEVIVVTRTVPVGDLDLTSMQGRKTARRRLQVAARKVCDTLTPPMPGRYLENNRCYGQVLEQAMAQLPGVRNPPAQQIAAGNGSEPRQ